MEKLAEPPVAVTAAARLGNTGVIGPLDTVEEAPLKETTWAAAAVPAEL